MLMKVVFEKNRVDADRVIPFTKNRITITIARTVIDANAAATVIKKAFKILWSLAL